MIENFIRLMLLFVIFAGLIGEAQQRPPLQGGVSSSQQLDTSPAHVSGLMADIDRDVGVVGQALRPSFENAVNADFSEFDAELKAGSSAAQQYVPCVQQYRDAYAHFVRATDLWVQYSNLRSSASSATLNAILQHMNQELTLGGAPYHAARNCYQHVPPQQPDGFNSNGGQGGGESNPNPTPARARKTPWSGRGSSPPRSQNAANLGNACGFWVGIVQQYAGGKGTGTVRNIQCFWYSDDRSVGHSRLEIPAPAFIQGTYDPPGASPKACHDAFMPTWVSQNGSNRFCPSEAESQKVGKNFGDFLPRYEITADQSPSSGQSQPPLNGNAQDTTCKAVPDSAWPPLVALENALKQIAGSMGAPYDMTRSGEGVRAAGYMVQNSLVNLGFSWLMKGASAFISAAVTRTAASLPFPAWSWTPPRAGTFAPLTSVKLPPGLKIPAVLLNTPRPVYLQEKAASCGLTCVKMVVQTVQRQSRPESWYRALARGPYGSLDPCAYQPGLGTGFSRIAELIRQAGTQASLKSGQIIKDLFAATQNGYPAIVHVGDQTAGHFVIVDGFAQDATGNWYVIGRDPWNLSLLDANARWTFQQLGFRNYAIYSLQDFLGSGGWTGWAIYTTP